MSQIPERYTLEQIEAAKNKIPCYVVLPVPPLCNPNQFETVGRTTFKKYVRHSYDELYARNELPRGNYLNIPFIVLRSAKNPYVVDTSTRTTANVNIPFKETPPISDGFAPPHTNIKHFKLSSTDLDIAITNENPRTFHNCQSFDAHLVNGDFWHLIVIHHERRVTKQQILDQLFEVVADSEFFPVCYTQSKLEDYFLIRLCRTAIERLFARSLQLMFGLQPVFLTVKFQVAQFKLGQVYPSKKYQRAINEKMQQLISCDGATNVLNLDNFSSLKEFEHLCVNLSNKMSLQLLFTTLNNLNEKFKELNVKGLRLSNNNIKTFESASKLSELSLDLVDLRNNKIRTVQELANLKRIKIKHLLLDGNPCVNNVGFKKDIREMFPGLEKLDQTRLESDNESMSLSSDRESPFKSIEITNTSPNDLYKSTDADHDLRKFQKYKTPLATATWHQVIVYHNGKLSQGEILDSLFDAVSPFDFMPCYYRPDTSFDSFFVRDCYDALEALYHKKLKITTGGNVIIRISLKMSVAPIKETDLDPSKVIHTVIGSNYDIMNSSLNLERFGENDLFENVICRINVPRTLTNVLTFASRKYGSNIVKLDLTYNALKSARGMHPLLWMKGLKEINLSNNKIEELKLLEPMPKGTITSMWLEGNPLCLKYTNPNDYVNAVKEVIPNLELLDGHETNKPPLVSTKQNFLCSLEGYDLVEQFVQHYYTCFDSVSRSRVMKGMYHMNAILTMSINSSGMPDNLATRMSPIIDKCRNFKRVVSSNASQNIFQGPERISSLLGIFGQTEHDFSTFTIDLTAYTPTQAVITVNGMFRETAQSLNDEDVILGFSRTFIIGKQAEKLGMFHASEEYQIYNDIVLYYRPSILQLNNSFKTLRPNVVTDDDDEVTDEDKLGLEVIFHELTGLNNTWCKKILSAASWNVRESLESFISLLTDKQIPARAFS